MDREPKPIKNPNEPSADQNETDFFVKGFHEYLQMKREELAAAYDEHTFWQNSELTKNLNQDPHLKQILLLGYEWFFNSLQTMQEGSATDKELNEKKAEFERLKERIAAKDMYPFDKTITAVWNTNEFLKRYKQVVFNDPTEKLSALKILELGVLKETEQAIDQGRVINPKLRWPMAEELAEPPRTEGARMPFSIESEVSKEEHYRISEALYFVVKNGLGLQKPEHTEEYRQYEIAPAVLFKFFDPHMYEQFRATSWYKEVKKQMLAMFRSAFSYIGAEPDKKTNLEANEMRYDALAESLAFALLSPKEFDEELAKPHAVLLETAKRNAVSILNACYTNEDWNQAAQAFLFIKQFLPAAYENILDEPDRKVDTIARNLEASLEAGRASQDKNEKIRKTATAAFLLTMLTNNVTVNEKEFVMPQYLHG